MNLDDGRRVDGDVNVFVPNRVPGDHSSANRRAASATINIDTHSARRGRVEQIGKIAMDNVADNDVSIHVICRKTKGRAYMRVQTDPSKTVAGQNISDHNIA